MSTKPRASWTEARRAALRGRSGHYSGKKLAPVLRRYRAQGFSLPELVALSGIAEGSWRNASRYAGHEPLHGVLLCDLAAELQVTPQAVCLYAKYCGLKIKRWGWKAVVSPQDAKIIRAHYANQIGADTPGEWWSMAQLAAYFDVSPATMHGRLTQPAFASIRHQRLRGAQGNTHTYNADDARRVKNTLPVALSTPPAGHWTSAEVATVLGICPPVVTSYARSGAPHTRIRRGSHYTVTFDPYQLAAWLLAAQHPLRRSLGKALNAQLHQRRAA